MIMRNLQILKYLLQITHNPSAWELYAKLYLSNDNIKDTETVKLIWSY